MRHITEELKRDFVAIIKDEFYDQGCDDEAFESAIRQQVERMSSKLECMMNPPMKLHMFGVTRRIWNYRGKWYIADSFDKEEPCLAYQVDCMPEQNVDLAWIDAHTVKTLWYSEARELIARAFKN